MKFYYIYLIFVLFVTSCSNREPKTNLIKDNSSLKYAKNFTIIKSKNQTFIHLINPENQSIEKKYILIKSKNKTIPKGYTPIQIPIKSIIALSSTHIGMLSKIDACAKVKGVSNHLYVHEPSILKRYTEGKIIEMGEENSIPVESIIRSKAELIMYSGFGKTFPHEDQLEKMGIICLANYDWKEIHPLGKAEWIKLFGLLTGKEKLANNYFNNLEKEYKKLTNLAKKTITKPSLFSGNLVGDIWYSPAGESYNSILFHDAHGNYKYSNTKGIGSVEHSFEQIFNDNFQTEFWFNPGVVSKKALLKAQPKFKLFHAFQRNKVYSYTYSGNKFWERSAIEPHHVLSDLIQILHPELKLKNKLYFYRTLDK